MAPVEDLSFQAVSNEAADPLAVFFVGTDYDGELRVLLSVSGLCGNAVDSLDDLGMIELIVKLRELCRKAQDTANATAAAGERLSAFPPSTTTGTLLEGYIEQTGTIKARIDLSSATTMVGVVA